MSSELPDLDEAISFAVDNGAQAGPFSMRSIVDSVKQGQRLPSTLVWWAGEPDWVPFNSVPGLVALTQDPVETLPPPPSGDLSFGSAAPAGAADATMTFGTADAAAADAFAAEPSAAEPAAADPFAAEAATQAYEPQAQAEAFEAQVAAEPAAAAAESFGFADTGSAGDVIEMGGGEVDATQVWAAPDAAVEPEANLVEAESADFSWASPEPSAADDVWADAEAPATTEGEPESTDGGGLSTGLFGAGAGAVAAAGAAAGGIFSGGADAVEDAVPDGADLGGVADALPGAADVSGAFGDVVAEGGDIMDGVTDAMPDAGDLAANVDQVMPDPVSPLQSVNERIEALGADSPVAAFEPAESVEAVADTAAEFVEEAAPVEAVAAVEDVVPAADPVVEMVDPVVEMAEPDAFAMGAADPVEAPVEEAFVAADPVAEAFMAEEPAAEEPALAGVASFDADPTVAEEAAPVAAVASETVEAPVEDAQPAVTAQTALFNDLLDRSAVVEASELRADRKIVVMLAGFMNVAAERGLAVLDMVATGLQHSVRFENPADGTRTTVALGNAGSHVRMAFGFGTPVADPGSVLTSTAWDDGPIMIGADTDDGLAFTGVDLYVDPADYVTDAHTVNGDALGAMFDALSGELRSSLLDGLDD